MNPTLTRTLLFAVSLTSPWAPVTASAAPKDPAWALDKSGNTRRIEPEILTGFAARKFSDEPGGAVRLTPAALTDPAPPDAATQAHEISTAAGGLSGEPARLAATATVTVLAIAGLLVLVGAIRVLSRRGPAGEETLLEPIPKAFLNDLEGATDKPSYELGESLTVVGRVKGGDVDGINYVTIPEPTIGRRHALIEFRDRCFWVTDQNSLNGTFINDKRVEGDTRLKHGDRVRFHRHEFEFLLLDMFESDITMSSGPVFGDVPRSLDTDNRAKPLAPADP